MTESRLANPLASIRSTLVPVRYAASLAAPIAAVLVVGASAATALHPARPDLSEGTYVHIDEWPLPPALPAPIDVAVTADGSLLVADCDHNVVHRYSADGAHDAEWGRPPFSWPGYLLLPVAVVADADRDRVYILWERRSEDEPQGSTRALFLDERNPDGSQARPPLAVTFAATATDMALHPETGELYVAASGQVHILRMPARVHSGSISVGRTDGAYGRLAVTSGGIVVLPRPEEHSISLYDSEGGHLRSVHVGSARPVAAASRVDGSICLLLAYDAPPEAAQTVVKCITPTGEEVGSLASGDIGAVPPPGGGWPWALDTYESSVAFTTAESRFQVSAVHEDGGSAARIEGAVARAEFVAKPQDTRPEPALSLALSPDGELVAMDALEGRLVAFDAQGAPRLAGAVPKSSADVCIGASGESYVATSDGALMRLEAGDVVSSTWHTECRCSLGGRLAFSAQGLYVTKPREHKVASHSAATGEGIGEVANPEGVGLWPSDIAADLRGRLYTADLVTASVQRWDELLGPAASWQAGLLAGPRRLAAGRLADGSEVVAAAMADGYVELHSASDGNLIARWNAVKADSSPFDPSDIAVGQEGNVFLANAQTRTIHLFGPGAGVPTPPVAEPSPTPTPSDRSCTIHGDKVAEPVEIIAGGEVTVSLGLAAECPGSAKVVGADIVLAIDRSSSMTGSKMQAAKGAARSFAELLDVRYHKLGLTTFSTAAVVEVGLTADVGHVIEAIELVTMEDLGQTNISAALAAAQDNLQAEGRPEALPAIVLLTDGQHNADTSDPRQIAEVARNRGTVIYTVGLGTDVDEAMLTSIAGSRDRYFFAPSPSELFPIYGQILRQVLDSLAGNLTIDDELGDMMSYSAGSARPDALVSPGRLRWGRSILPSSGITLTYRLVPQLPGCRPTNRRAVAYYTDGDGVRREYEFPIPTVCVITPTPHPTATPAPTPVAIMLPLVERNHCVPGSTHVDTVLLIDTSDSMAGTKLEQAKSAAISFLQYLDLPQDQAAVIGFDSRQVLAQGLTGDREKLAAAVRSLSPGRGTHIDRALLAAVQEFLSVRRRPRNRPVVVLLSDGAHNGYRSDVIAAAASVRSVGATIYAIGLGPDADEELLRGVSGNDNYYFAPGPSDLEAIYREIAVALPCP